MARRGNKSRRNAPRKTPADQSGMRLLPMPKMVTHRFVRNVLFPVPTVAVGGGYPVALAFDLTQVPNYTEFTNLFDFWTIDRVDISILAASSTLQVVACVDYNDATLPASQAELLERGEAEITTLSAAGPMLYRRTVIPRVSTEVFQGLTTGYHLGPVGALVDTGTAAVPFYGVKMWFTGTTTGSNIALKYHLRFVGEK